MIDTVRKDNSFVSNRGYNVKYFVSNREQRNETGFVKNLYVLCGKID